MPTAQEVESWKKMAEHYSEKAKVEKSNAEQKEKEMMSYKLFYEHILNHFKKEHPDWKVKCKICDKSFDEIVKESKSRFSKGGGGK